MHNVGNDFIAEVVKVRKTRNAQSEEELHTGERLEFLFRIRGSTELLEWQSKRRGQDQQNEDKDNHYLPREQWPDSPPPRIGNGWWYSCRTDVTFRTCRTCKQRFMNHHGANEHDQT